MEIPLFDSLLQNFTKFEDDTGGEAHTFTLIQVFNGKIVPIHGFDFSLMQYE